VPTAATVPLVLNSSRLRSRGDQFIKGWELVGGTTYDAAEVRLKQRDATDYKDSLDVPDDELFVSKPGWVEEQDRRYTANSQDAWKRMQPSDIAREGYMKMEAPHSHSHKKKGPPGRSAQRRAEADQRRKKKEGLYPSPSPAEMDALRNK
jgi:hypothetical protein